MRRTLPEKRAYVICLAMDDSQSMHDTGAGTVAASALVTLLSALSTLEVGDVGVYRFGDSVHESLALGSMPSPEACQQVLNSFTFAQTETNVALLLSHLSSTLSAHATERHAIQSDLDLLDITIIISDGRVLRDQEQVAAQVRQAHLQRRLIVYVLLDMAKDSVVDMKSVRVLPGGKIVSAPFLDSFPFPYYLVLRDVNMLPTVLADALRQWFELLQNNL